MGKEPLTETPKPSESPDGGLLLALQNRINDLEAKLQTSEKERTSKAWIDLPTLESAISGLKAEISELRKSKKELTEPPKISEPPKNEPPKAENDNGLGIFNLF